MQNRNRLLARRCCSGHSIFCSCDSAVRFLDSRNFKQTSTTATSGAAPSALRSALDLNSEAYAQILVWPRRDVPTRFTWRFFQQNIRAQHESCCCYSVCALAATKDARWVRWSPCSLGPSPRRPTASCSLAAVRRGDCVRASWLYS